MNKAAVAAAVAAIVAALNVTGFGVSKEVEDAVVGVLYGLTILAALFVKPPTKAA